MTESLLEYKWLLVIGSEVLFWVLSAFFLVLRYWLRLRRASFVFLILVVANELFAAGLAVLDYARTGAVGEFQIVMAAVLLYAATAGRRDFKRLDAYFQRKVAEWRGEAPPPDAAPAARKANTKPGSLDQEHARKERRGFYGHLLLFAIGQAILVAVGESWIAAQLGGQVPGEPSGLMAAGRIWCIVLVVDGIWSLSYTFFPRRVKG